MTDPTCAACGHPRSNHPYRHRFVGPSLEDDVKDLETKLAKAVAALDMLVRDCEADYPPSHGAIKHFAIATLAEIKSGVSHE